MNTFRAFADSGRVALAEMTGELERLAIQLERGDGTIPRSLRDPELMRLLEDIGTQVAVLERSWTARPVLVDSSSMASLENLSRSTSALGEAAAQRKAPLEQAVSALTRLGARIDRLNLAMRSGQGTAGRLLHDGELEAQAGRARAQLDSLQTELTANPLAWLRFRLF